MSLTNFCSHRHSNLASAGSNRHSSDPQHVFLAGRPSQCVLIWSHQGISMEEEMILLSAHRVELEVHCDDDRWKSP